MLFWEKVRLFRGVYVFPGSSISEDMLSSAEAITGLFTLHGVREGKPPVYLIELPW